jgi:hypothetical protein
MPTVAWPRRSDTILGLGCGGQQPPAVIAVGPSLWGAGYLDLAGEVANLDS